MATLDLTSYSGLQTAVAQYLNRRDLNDQIPAFIWQAHAKLNRELRVRDMQTKIVGTSSGDAIPIPVDWLATITLEIGDTVPRFSVEYISEDQAAHFRALNPNVPGSHRLSYTIFGGEFELLPALGANTPYTLRYFARIPAMSGPSDSNWLLLKSPDLYVVSSCLEAMPYLENDERIATWGTFRQQIIDAMNLESDRALKPQSALNATRRTFG